jgi:hypothetical protein
MHETALAGVEQPATVMDFDHQWKISGTHTVSSSGNSDETSAGQKRVRNRMPSVQSHRPLTLELIGFRRIFGIKDWKGGIFGRGGHTTRDPYLFQKRNIPINIHAPAMMQIAALITIHFDQFHKFLEEINVEIL